MNIVRVIDKDRLMLVAEQNITEGDYWRTKLSGDIEKSVIPYDFRDFRDASTPGEKKTFSFPFPTQLFDQAMQLSKGSDVKLHMLLAAGLFVLMHKYTGKEDIIIGSPIARQTVEGDFANTVLAFRDTVEPRAAFKDLLMQIRQTIVDANRNQNYPIEILINQLELEMTETEFPLFDIALVLDSIHDKEYMDHIPYNLLFSFSRLSNRIEGIIEYTPGRFREETIHRIADHYIHILEQAFPDVNRTVSDIHLMRPAQVDQVLREFNRTGTIEPPEVTLHRWFEESVGRFSQNTALIYPVPEVNQYKSVNYEELNRVADGLATALNKSGAESGSIIAIMAEPSLEMFAGILGILKTGAAYLPLDPDAPADRVNYILADSSVKTAVTGSPACREKLAAVPGLSIIDAWDLDRKGSGVTEDKFSTGANVQGNDPAYIIYTSGTTGKPKGVVVEHRNITRYIAAFLDEFNYDESKVTVQLASYTFDLFLEEVFPVLLRGGRVVIPEIAVKTDFNALNQFMTHHKVNVIDTTPLLLNGINMMIRESGLSAEDRGYRFTFINGGDEIKPGYIDHLLNVGDVYNTYGPTETTVCATFHRYSDDERGSIPIGKPIAGYRTYVLDKNRNPLPVGLPGELCVAGAGVTRGYLNRPELTAEKFVPDPFSNNNDILYRTGDLVRWQEDGAIEFLGRIDTQVKIRGYRIELGEIENRILQHPKVKETVVTVAGDNQDEKFICAYFVQTLSVFGVEGDSSQLAADIRDYLGRYLPEYMIPSVFIPIEFLPLTASGKVDMKKLPAPQAIITSHYEPPVDEIEEKMVDLWSRVLEVDAPNIGRNHNFFELGGHSLRGTILITKIHQEMNVRISLAEVFEMPILKDLCAYIRNAATDTFKEIEPVEMKEYYPLSPGQKRMLVLQSLSGDSITYNMPFDFRLTVPFNKERIIYAFRELTARHESLRTAFMEVDGQMVQRVFPAEDVELPITFHDTDASADIYQIRRNSIRPFDLEKAPLCRVTWIKYGDTSHQLLIDMHHIISDAETHKIITNEIADIYRGQELTPLKLQYRDFAEWSSMQLESEVGEQQHSFWIKELSGDTKVPELPADYPRQSVREMNARCVEFRIKPEETRVLREYAREANMSRFMLGLALFNVFMYKMTGSTDITLGTVSAGRRHPDLEPIVGFFINTIVLRNYPEPGRRFVDFLEDVRDRCLAAFDNQDFPFEDLVQALLPRRDPARHPLFDILYAYRETADDPSILQLPGNSRELQEGDGELVPGMREGKFDFTISCNDQGAEIGILLEFNTSLFKEESVYQFVRYYREIIAQVVENKEILLGDISISHSLGSAGSTLVKDDADDFGF